MSLFNDALFPCVVMSRFKGVRLRATQPQRFMSCDLCVGDSVMHHQDWSALVSPRREIAATRKRKSYILIHKYLSAYSLGLAILGGVSERGRRRVDPPCLSSLRPMAFRFTYDSCVCSIRVPSRGGRRRRLAGAFGYIWGGCPWYRLKNWNP